MGNSLSFLAFILYSPPEPVVVTVKGRLKAAPGSRLLVAAAWWVKEILPILHTHTHTLYMLY